MSIAKLAHRYSIPTACALLILGCGGERSPSPAASSTPPAASAGSGSAPKMTPTGKVITIEMITDEAGNYFKPKNIEANRGDVLRFVLTTGVHNVHFLPDSNPGAANLPAMSAFAQLPGQAFEIVVTMDAGKQYYFQCDPHALLGMIGHVTVRN